jgi:mono/diheme cytochrome c family protein
MATRRRQRPPSTGSRLLSQRNAIIVFVLLSALALAVFAIRSGARSDTPRLGRADPGNDEQVGLGQRLYATRCASCHGANLEGGPAVALDEQGPAGQRDDGSIFTAIEDGTGSGMPAFGGALSDEQIWALIAYMKSERQE